MTRTAICRKRCINYLARLGWSHGDDEVFSVASSSCSGSTSTTSRRRPRSSTPKSCAGSTSITSRQPTTRGWPSLARPFLVRNGANPDDGPDLAAVCALVKERAATIEELADAATLFYRTLHPTPGTAGAARHPGSVARAGRPGWPS